MLKLRISLKEVTTFAIWLGVYLLVVFGSLSLFNWLTIKWVAPAVIEGQVPTWLVAAFGVLLILAYVSGLIVMTGWVNRGGPGQLRRRFAQSYVGRFSRTRVGRVLAVATAGLSLTFGLGACTLTTNQYGQVIGAFTSTGGNYVGVYGYFVVNHNTSNFIEYEAGNACDLNHACFVNNLANLGFRAAPYYNAINDCGPAQYPVYCGGSPASAYGTVFPAAVWRAWDTPNPQNSCFRIAMSDSAGDIANYIWDFATGTPATMGQNVSYIWDYNFPSTFGWGIFTQGQQGCT